LLNLFLGFLFVLGVGSMQRADRDETIEKNNKYNYIKDLLGCNPEGRSTPCE